MTIHVLKMSKRSSCVGDSPSVENVVLDGKVHYAALLCNVYETHKTYLLHQREHKKLLEHVSIISLRKEVITI